MKIHLYSWIMLSLILSKTSQGMDRTIKNFTQLQEITAPEPIRAVAFLDREKIVLGTKNGCHITTIQNPSHSTPIHTSPASRIAINRNRNKLLTWNGGSLHSYDTKKKERFEWPDLPLIYSAAFSPTDDTIFVHKNRNFIINCGKQYILRSHLEGQFAIGYHPTKKQIIYPSNNSTVTTMDFERNPPTISSFFIKNLYPSRQIQEIFYNSDGNYLALIHNDYLALHVTLYNSLTKSSCYLGKCLAMKFHPNNIIAALILQYGTIEFWNIKTHKLVMEKKLSSTKGTKISCYDIDFSPNGIQFIIRTNTQCFLGMVPPELYETDTRNRCVFVWYMFKCFNDNGYITFPEDIARLIMNNLIELSQF